MLDYVVIETNALAALTINAINEHDPGAKITCTARYIVYYDCFTT